MEMELEEAIEYLKKIAKEYKTYGDLDNPEFEDIMKIAEAIETVLQELKYKDEQIEKLYNDCKELEDYKDEYEKGNLIPKKKIEKLIDDLYGDENTIYGTIRIIEMLKELLEDK